MYQNLSNKNKSRSVSDAIVQKQEGESTGKYMVDNRPRSVIQKKQFEGSIAKPSTEVIQMVREGRNPWGKGNPKTYIKQKKPPLAVKPQDKGKHGKKPKLKFDHGKIVYQMLILGGKLHFDPSITPENRNKVLALITFVRMMANTMEDNPLVGYLEAIHRTIARKGNLVSKVVLKATPKGAEGHYDKTGQEVVLSIGTVGDDGTLELKNPMMFLTTLVHEFGHVMDMSLRAEPAQQGEQPVPNSYDQAIESENNLSKYLKAMISSVHIGGYAGKSKSSKWSEIIARFSEIGVVGIQNEMIFGFKQIWQEFYIAKYQELGGNADPDRNAAIALPFANLSIDHFQNRIIFDIIMPYVKRTGSKDVEKYFTNILLHLPNGSEIAAMVIE